MLILLLGIVSCSSDNDYEVREANSLLDLAIPADFPPLNVAFYTNQPTKFGVELGEKLFFDPRLSRDNSIACASCHMQKSAYADHPNTRGWNRREGRFCAMYHRFRI